VNDETWQVDFYEFKFKTLLGRRLAAAWYRGRCK
jgi:hypothetical protein